MSSKKRKSVSSDESAGEEIDEIEDVPDTPKERKDHEEKFERPAKKAKTEAAQQHEDEFYLHRHTVIVRGIPHKMDARALGDLLGSVGALKAVRISTSGQNHDEPRGFAYVSYFEGRDAEAAVMKLNRTHAQGNELSIEFVRCYRCGKEGHFTLVESPAVQRRRAMNSSSSLQLLSSQPSQSVLSQQDYHHQGGASIPISSQSQDYNVLDLSHTSHEAAAASQLFGDSASLQSLPSTLSLPHTEQTQQTQGQQYDSQLVKAESSVSESLQAHPFMTEPSDAEMLEAAITLDQHSQLDIQELFDASIKSEPQSLSSEPSQPEEVQIIPHLTKSQLRKGLEVLEELEVLLQSHQGNYAAIRREILDHSNQFYSLVPHKFQADRRPELLDNLEIVEHKIQKIEDLLQVY